MSAAVYHRGVATTPTSRDDWQTPECVLERVRRVNYIWLDPCASPENSVGAAHCYTEDVNGLDLPWHETPDGKEGIDGLVYANPPYSAMKEWAAEIADWSLQCEIVSLVAARPDTKWFREMVWDSADAVCFWRGRLRFVGADSCAPFPSAVVYHGRNLRRFERAFSDAGKVIRL